MKSPLTLLVAVLLSFHFARADDAQDWTAIDKIEKRLQEIVLPKFEFHDAKLQDVLAYTAQILREQDKGGAGIPVLIDQHEIAFEEYGPPAPPSEIESRKVSVVLKNVSLHHALDYATAVANVSLSIHPDGIHLFSGYAPDYLLTREFQIPQEFFRSVPPGTSDPAAFVRATVLDYFVHDIGWFSPDHSWEDSHMCAFNATATRMTVRETKENLERIERSLTFPEKPYIPGPEVPKVLSADDEVSIQHAWQKNMLPQVSFKNTPLEEAVQYLRLRHLSDSWSDRYGILYESPNARDYRSISDCRPLPDTADADPKITYRAKNISAWDALHAIARQAHLEVLTTGWALRLTLHDTIYTRRYLIPPDAWPQSMVKAPPLYADGREGGQEWLMAGGVQFGEGTFLRFAFKDRTLSVSNTVTEHRKIQAMVEKAWRIYYAAQKTGKGKAQQAVSAPDDVTDEAKNLAAVVRIRKALDQVVLPKLNYDDTPTEEVLLFLVDRIREQKIDGHPIAVSLLARSPKDGPVPASSLLSEPPTHSLKWKASVSLENIPLTAALDYICERAHMKYAVRPDGIEIVPEDDSERMFERDFPIPPDFFPAYEKQDQLDHTHFAQEMRQDFRRWFLEDNGIYFYFGEATARLNADATRLTVRQTDIQLQTIADILRRTRPPCLFPTYELNEPKIIAHGDNAALMRKVQQIILPEVKFDDTRVIDALQILQDLSVRYDTVSPPASRGVKIVFEENGHPVPASPPNPQLNADPKAEYISRQVYERELDYNATQVTLLEVLEAVAARGQWEVHVGRSSVILRQPISGKAMITQEYLISPYWAAWIGARSRWPLDDLVRGLLIANGVHLRSGSSFHYDPSTSRLTLQNSEAEQQNARQWVERTWRAYYDAKAGKTKAARLAD